MLGRRLIHRHERLARSVLYLLPVLAALAGWWVVRYSRTGVADLSAWRSVDFASLESVQLLRDYVRIDTSASSGSEIAGAEFLARHLEAAGVAVHVEPVGERNANLWAIVEGEEHEAVVLHNHLDIVPVTDPEEWANPPFEGVIQGPWLFGPGAFDMKSVAIAQLLAFRDVAQRDTPPRRSLVFLATGDEETGSRLGTRRVLREQPELVSRFAVVLTEGGVVEARDVDSVKYWGTEIAQPHYVRLEVHDPDPDRLRELRSRLEERSRELAAERHLAPIVERFFAAYAPSRDSAPYRRALGEVRERLAAGELPQLPTFANSLLRKRLEVGDVEPREDGAGHRLEVRLILPPGADEHEAMPPALLDGFATVELDRSPPVDPDPAIVDHEAFRTIGKLVAARYGAEHGPMIVPWTVTDARFFRAAGIPTLGFSPFLVLATDTFSLEGPDERIPLPAFVAGVELYGDLVARLVDG